MEAGSHHTAETTARRLFAESQLRFDLVVQKDSEHEERGVRQIHIFPKFNVFVIFPVAYFYSKYSLILALTACFLLLFFFGSLPSLSSSHLLPSSVTLCELYDLLISR